MGSLGPPARAMAVRSAFALFCFALLCGLAASSIQSETETDLTKEDEAAGHEVLVEQAVESRVARGVEGRRAMLKKKCDNKPNGKACARLNKKTRKDKKQKAKRGRKGRRGNGGHKKGKKGDKKKGRNGNIKGRKRSNKNGKKKKENRPNKKARNKKRKLTKALKRPKAGNAKSNA